MAKKIIKSKNIGNIVKVTTDIGDTLATSFNNNNDLKVASAALSAYKTAISASKTQLIYKKLTGAPKKIDFLE